MAPQSSLRFRRLFVVAPQPHTQASSRYPSYQRRLGTECDSPRRTFPTSLAGDVTSEFAEDDWERGWWPRSLTSIAAGLNIV